MGKKIIKWTLRVLAALLIIFLMIFANKQARELNLQLEQALKQADVQREVAENEKLAADKVREVAEKQRMVADELRQLLEECRQGQ